MVGVRCVVMLAIGTAVAVAGCGPAAPVDAGPFTGKEATVVAANLVFQPASVSLPTGQPLRIVLDNRDNGVPHDIKLSQGNQSIAQSPAVTGPATTEIRFGPLTPGSYPFVCTIHPTMTGTLTITP